MKYDNFEQRGDNTDSSQKYSFVRLEQLNDNIKQLLNRIKKKYVNYDEGKLNSIADKAGFDWYQSGAKTEDDYSWFWAGGKKGEFILFLPWLNTQTQEVERKLEIHLREDRGNYLENIEASLKSFADAL